MVSFGVIWFWNYLCLFLESRIVLFGGVVDDGYTVCGIIHSGFWSHTYWCIVVCICRVNNGCSMFVKIIRVCAFLVLYSIHGVLHLSKKFEVMWGVNSFAKMCLMLNMKLLSLTCVLVIFCYLYITLVSDTGL